MIQFKRVCKEKINDNCSIPNNASELSEVQCENTDINTIQKRKTISDVYSGSDFNMSTESTSSLQNVDQSNNKNVS